MSTQAQVRPIRIAVCPDLIDLDVRRVFGALESAGHSVTLLQGSDSEAIVAEAVDADALMLGYGSLDDDAFARLPALRMVALASMGFDNVDVEAAHRRGVAVSNIVGAATEEVALHALALVLDALRGISAHDRAVRAGGWDLAAVPLPRRGSGLTLGIIGLGRIGLALAEQAAPIFGRIIGYDPVPGERSGVEQVSLEVALREADVISLHLPLTEETTGFLDAGRLGQLRRGAVIVNVSRGGLIDAAALRDALDDGRIGAAGLDVLDEEPPPQDHVLVNHPRVTITPHAAFLSDAALADYVRLQADNVLTWARTGRPLTPVPTGS